MTLSQRIHRASAWLLPAIAVVMALILSSLIDPYLAFLGASWVIFGLLGLSLDIVWGRGGFLSLGQTAFFGLGGYLGAIAAVNFGPLIGNTLLPTLPIAALFGGLCAGVLGSLIFFARMGPLQATILSYTFTLLLWSVTQSLKFTVGKAVVGGDNGMSGIPGIVIGFGAEARALAPNGVFAVCVVFAALAYFATLALMRSTFGRVVDCIRLDIQKTELLGYDVRRVQVANMAWAGAVAGLAGGLFALWSNYLNPSLFSVQEALLPPIHVLVGGLGTLAGPFVGALTIGGLSFWLGGGAAGGQTTLILGVVLVLLVLFLRNGILGALDQLWRRFLPDPNAAARDAGEVKINVNDLDLILREAEAQVGPAKPMATDQAFKRFGGVIPVNKVSRSFVPGRPMALIGPNGAGKSSYLKTCVGVYKPEGGQVSIGDTDVTDSVPRRGVGAPTLGEVRA